MVDLCVFYVILIFRVWVIPSGLVWFLVLIKLVSLDKIRCESLMHKTKMDAQPKLFLRIVPNNANITLIIINTEFDMTKLGFFSIPFDYMGVSIYDYVISIFFFFLIY